MLHSCAVFLQACMLTCGDAEVAAILKPIKASASNCSCSKEGAQQLCSALLIVFEGFVPPGKTKGCRSAHNERDCCSLAPYTLIDGAQEDWQRNVFANVAAFRILTISMSTFPGTSSCPISTMNKM